MTKTRVLTGITTTGTPHLGNYLGAIQPAIEASRDQQVEPFYFLADYHALIKCTEPERVKQSALEIAATWLALGLDTDNAVFYRQSDIPEIMELTWILTCITAKGLMNRAHAYKASVATNQVGDEQDSDKGIMMGLFSYPVLMAADILMFNAHKVPVGKDQIQHIEMARDIAGRFNHIYGDQFVLPEAVVDKNNAVITGLDGRKMSKTYNNTIPLFLPEKKFRKMIMKIKTNSLEPGQPKDPDSCTIFGLYKASASAEQSETMRTLYAEGIGWGDAKQMLFEHLNQHLQEARQHYDELILSPDYIEEKLLRGAEKARDLSTPFLRQLKEAVGICGLTG